MPRKNVVQEVVEAPSTECEEKPVKKRETRKKKELEPEFVSTTDIKLDQQEFKIPPSILTLFDDIDEFDITISCFQWEQKAHCKVKKKINK
jgi:hypothetical protein